MGETLKGRENVKLSRKLALSLRVASMIALGTALVPILSSPALAQPTITQNSPAQVTKTPFGTIGFTDTITVTGGDDTGYVFTTTSSSTNLSVDSTGGVSVSGAPLHIGDYMVSGTVDDTDDQNNMSGDQGQWSYELIVNAAPILQTSPTANSTTYYPLTLGAGWSQPLETSGSDGNGVSFVTTTSSTWLNVNSSTGEITATATVVPAGSYLVSGTDSDGSGDTGTWTYTLTVTPVTITQTSPTSNASALTPLDMTAWSEQLVTNDDDGGALSFLTTTSSSSLTVSSSGLIKPTSTLIPVGHYTVSGTDTDTDNDNGMWTYTLTITPATIAQMTPLSNSLTPVGTESLADQLRVMESDGGSLSFATTTSSPDISVSTGGLVTALTPPVPVGSYTVSGTVTDGSGDTGPWTYTLNVTAAPITQTAPMSGSTTPAQSSSFSDTLATTGNIGSASFTVTSSPPGPGGGLKVSSSGTVSTTGKLAAGNYTVSGNDTDNYGDTGMWTYSLTVNRGTITQTAPFSNSTKPASSASFTNTLTTAGSTGAVTFVTTTPEPGSGGGLKVSPAGVVTTTGPLTPGTYAAAGTDSDTYGDTGSWDYSLKISATAITQIAPSAATTTTGNAFSGQLAVSGTHGAVTYTQTSGAPDLSVSPSGKLTAPASLAAGVYKATGTVKDTSGDSGTWGFSLTVGATKLAQTAPTKATTTTDKAFSGQLEVTGAHGTVSYTQKSGAPDLIVSSSGKVSARAHLAKGTYKASGTVKDSSGDEGTWSFTLTVAGSKIAQIAPSTATTPSGKAFSSQLEVTGAHGTVTYTQATGSPHLVVSSSGKVSAKAGLVAGTYKATGSVKDSSGDEGTWNFTLTVTASQIEQIAPMTATTKPGKAFTSQLEVTGAHGTVIYAETSGAPDLTVSSSGKVSAPAHLAAGAYRATGTVKDSFGDEGTWSFALTIGTTTITQAAPTSAATTTGKAFTAQLAFSGAHEKVTFAQTDGAPELTVSSAGKVSAAGSLAAGTYKATGTAKDAAGDAGAWSFALVVTATQLVQRAPLTATTTTGKAFTGQLVVSGAHEVVTYAESIGAPELAVSSSGKVAASANLVAGTYKATGTAKDSLGDSGDWSFTLVVAATKLVQSAPLTAATTTGKAFTDQLVVSGAHGAVTYAEATGSLVLKVSSTGKVANTTSLVAGTYKATGVVRDVLGDSGTWSFDLRVVATKLTQVAPMTASTKTGMAFTGQLQVAGAHGAVTYAQSSGGLDLKVSSSGKISAAATLAAGTYKATGTARDRLGDTGDWSFTLTVVATKLAQVAPMTASTKAGKALTGQLQVAGAHGTVTYAQSAGGLDLKVSSSGKISAAATLAAGTYKATGTARDTLGDTGDWIFTLTVIASKLTQVAPMTASTKAGKAFTGQLQVSAAHGTVTYAQSTGSADLMVSSSGKITTAATLTAGTYKATGTARDRLGDTGDWSFTLTVLPSKLTQVAPDTAVNKVGKAFTGQLAVSGATGTVTYAQTTGAPHLKVSSSGKISAVAGLAAGTYKATGTVKDAYGDTGKWTFTLTVKGTKLTQVAPITGTTTAGKAYTTKLVVSGAHGTVTFTASSTGTQILSVTPSGTILAPDIFTPGTYKITGIMKDSLGDEGTWSFLLIVEAAALPPA
ncbi:MAG: beta strand repeat-containing protein [Acidimicrobiales bacterium]